MNYQCKKIELLVLEYNKEKQLIEIELTPNLTYIRAKQIFDRLKTSQFLLPKEELKEIQSKK